MEPNIFQSKNESQNASSAPSPSTRPKNKLPKWAKILIAIGASVALIGVVAILVVTFVLKNNDSEVKGFLGRIYASDYSAAYEYFSPELMEVQSQDSFESQAQTLETVGITSGCDTNWSTNIASSSTSTGSTKEIKGVIDCAEGSFDANFKLVKKNDGYKIYSYSIMPRS